MLMVQLMPRGKRTMVCSIHCLCRLNLTNTEIKRIASMIGATTEVDIRHVPGQSMVVDEHLKLFEIIYDFLL